MLRHSVALPLLVCGLAPAAAALMVGGDLDCRGRDDQRSRLLHRSVCARLPIHYVARHIVQSISSPAARS